MARSRTTFEKGDKRERKGGIGAAGQLRRDLTMVLIQKLHEIDPHDPEKRTRMSRVVDNLIARATYVFDQVDEKGRTIRHYGDLAAIKYIFDRLEGRPALAASVPKDTAVQTEFRNYEEVRQGLLQRGIDIESLPRLGAMREDDDTKH